MLKDGTVTSYCAFQNISDNLNIQHLRRGQTAIYNEGGRTFQDVVLKVFKTRKTVGITQSYKIHRHF